VWGGNEKLGEVRERKFGHRLMCGWGCHLIFFAHLAFVAEYLDPGGLLCCKYLHMQAKWECERSDCCEPCSVPYSYYAKCGLVAREVISEYVM